MYQVAHPRQLLRLRRVRVARNVVLLGLVSLFTDISSEMVATILPLYLVYTLGFTPLQFGIVDGLQQGAAALVRVAGGFFATARASTRRSLLLATASPRSRVSGCSSRTPFPRSGRSCSSIAPRRARVIHEGECPSLSPDETRIAYKKRRGNTWRLHVLDLASGRETALAETRSVDDQVEWLDDERIMYGLAGDVWVVPADDGGRPRVYIPDAVSPAVVRS
jgi:hypothetical protein